MRVSLAIILTLTLLGVAQAEDVKYEFTGFNEMQTTLASHQSEIDSLRAELAAFRSTNIGGGPAVAGKGYCDSGCGGISCSTCCGIEGGIDLVLLSPVFGRAHNYDPADASEIDLGLGVGVRAWVGYVNECGFGGRIRYFDYDQGETVDTTGFADSLADTTAELSVDLTNFDIEALQRMTVCRWDTTFSGGIRIASIEERFAEVGPLADESAFTKFEGAGPTFAFEARRPLGASALSLFGSLRGSLLYGERTYFTESDELVGDDLVTAFEAQLGAEYSRYLRNCGGPRFFVRGAFEAQTYISGGQFFSEDQIQNETIPDDGYDAAADLGLVGFSISAGIAR